MPPKQSKALKLKYKTYYEKVLLQFLGFEKDIYVNNNGSLAFYAYPYGRMVLWIAANKIQRTKDRVWVSDADFFIINSILKKDRPPTFHEYYSGVQTKINL